MSVKILANDGIDAIGKLMLEEAGFSVDTNKISQNDLLHGLKNYEVVIVRSASKITKEIIEANTHLKVIARAGVGLDNVDVETAKRNGIRVINTPAASSISVAELVFAHLFGMVRNLPESNRMMPEQGIDKFNELKKKFSEGFELRDKTLGVIGFGRIGQEAARIAIGLGMNVIAFDPFVEKAEIYFYFNSKISDQRIKFEIKTVSKEEVLRNADFITLHVPSTEKPTIAKLEFDLMKQGAVLVNCARGGVVNENDLLGALNVGKLRYAALDVFENEPPLTDTILKHPKLSLTPHIGASTAEAQNRIGIELAEKIIDLCK
ncbi:MAG: D-2-hydroxyacid dehydrogenase [Bacteroidetes bacterium]|nr:D-2-hydroxyacid dehydrogenase [Bacteroidota bacterium]